MFNAMRILVAWLCQAQPNLAEQWFPRPPGNLLHLPYHPLPSQIRRSYTSQYPLERAQLVLEMPALAALRGLLLKLLLSEKKVHTIGHASHLKVHRNYRVFAKSRRLLLHNDSAPCSFTKVVVHAQLCVAALRNQTLEEV